jgi:hypothetical protein
MTTLKLLIPHRHGGKEYPAGADIETSQADAELLINNNIATAIKSTNKPEIKEAQQDGNN